MYSFNANIFTNEYLFFGNDMHDNSEKSKH